MDVAHAGLPLEIVRLHAFLNSIDLRSFSRGGERHRGGERLSTPRDLTGWLREQGLIGAGVSATDRDLARTHELRERLRASLEGPRTAGARAGEAGSGGSPPGHDASGQATSGQVTSGHDRSGGGASVGPLPGGRSGPAPGVPVPAVRLSCRLIFEPGRPPALAPAQEGVDGALAALMLSVADAVAAGTWERLKMCEAPDCRWVFYDRSRPNRGRWCAAELCGNRMKTKAYRERRR